MALHVFTSSVAAPGVQATLADGEDLFVAANVIVASTDTSAVIGGGSNHRAEIYGSVLSNFIGLDIGNSDTDVNNVIVVRATGLVQEFSQDGAAIRMRGTGSILDNRGEIHSQDFGVLMGSNGTGISKIINSGLIEAADARAIVRFGSSTETISTVNTGTIRGVTASYDGKLSALGKDLITNNGKMFGDIILGAGDDTYKGTNGRLTGKVLGGDGKDTLLGGIDHDKMSGGIGDDALTGGAGNDTLAGDEGIDTLYGGLGKDTLTGGTGKDTFIFKAIGESTVATSGRDIIKDFSRAQADKIDLSAIDASTKLSGNQEFKFIQTEAFHKVAGELRFQIVSGDTIISGDVNGDGKADFSIALDLSLVMKGTDFLL